MIRFQTHGYESRSLISDIALGVFDGIDNSLWCYGFAAIIFAGSLAGYMPLMLGILLVGWSLMGILTAVTSGARVHLINLDEQAVVILSTIGGLMVAEMGDRASTTMGLSTMFAVISLTSLTVALSFLIVGRFQLTRLLELLPYPVICGFMAGIGWLLLQAGVGVAVDLPISRELVAALGDSDNVVRLLLMVLGGLVLMAAAKRARVAWALPATALLILAVFYAVSSVMGLTHEELVANKWLFDFSDEVGGALEQMRDRSFFQIDVPFVLSVIPQILTIAFLAMLSASMSMSAMMAGGNPDLSTAEEMQVAGTGNVMMGLMGCPPGYTDVTSSLLYREFGASSRWMALTSCAVTLIVAMAGSWLVSWMPTLVVGSIVFLFAFQMLFDWMYHNARGFQPVDYAIVCIILGTVIIVGFMSGILVGILLALLLFVMRYSMISAVQGRYSLATFRSSVERSPRSNQLLDEHGSGALVYTLRGFLFFGTANAILDTIRDESAIRSGQCKAILLDLKRVTGMDISALKTFLQIRHICEAAGVKLMYSGIPKGTEQRIVLMDAVSRERGRPLFFKEADYAVEYMENVLLEDLGENDEAKSISDFLMELLDDEHKVDLLMGAMTRVECDVGHTLFQQGETDDGLFILESGSMTALIGTPTNGMKRVKKFNAGSVIGEMSSYTPDRKRTATIIANEPSVLYHLSAATIAGLDEQDYRLVGSIHELVARTLGGRIAYMNRRLIQELR
ncbi:SulP family inorganic anion transporter [Elongatibacter sediminis]|uniref:SulP family inorganic anion transporter n=1 Tax=Elongatibacter sediminis TaxID=3119006 RepID=A0AAW9RER1_9GAMM